MNNIRFKRITAYLIDFLIVSLLIELLAQINFLNPYKEKYNKAVLEYNEIVEEYNDNVNNVDKNMTVEEYQNLINPKNIVSAYYNVAKYSVSNSLIFVVIIVLYYTLFPYFYNGQTIGKKMVKLKNESFNNKNIPLYVYILKSLFLPFYSGTVFRSAFSELLVVLSILIFKNNYFAEIFSVIVLIDVIWGFADCLCFIIRKDGKSIHDKVFKINCSMLENK